MNDLFQENCCPHCGRGYEAKSAPGFDDFWSRVPHKIGKAHAQKAWGKLSSADRAIAAEKVGAFYGWFAKTYATASPLHPATYLNGKRWLDEPISGSKSAISEEAKAGIMNGLLSPIAAVREHAQRMAERHGLAVTQ